MAPLLPQAPSWSLPETVQRPCSVGTSFAGEFIIGGGRILAAAAGGRRWPNDRVSENENTEAGRAPVAQKLATL